jgi:molybdenum cofactor guanylyltransferase
MPAAVLAGGASRRMGRAKAALPYGAGTLLEFQVARLSALFEEVLVVVKSAPPSPIGSARLVLDRMPEHAAIHGLARALEEARDRIFVLAVDVPAIPPALIRALAERSLASDAAAVVPEADGRLQPLAAVWRRRVLPAVERRLAAGAPSLQELSRDVGAEIVTEAEWRAVDSSGNAFANLNTLEEYAAMRERA